MQVLNVPSSGCLLKIDKIWHQTSAEIWFTPKQIYADTDAILNDAASSLSAVGMWAAVFQWQRECLQGD